MALKYTTPILAGGYLRMTVTHIGDTNSDWDSFPVGGPFYDSPTECAEALIAYLIARPGTIADLQANMSWLAGGYSIKQAPLGGFQEEWVRALTISGTLRIVKISSATIVTNTKFTGAFTNLSGSIDYPVGYEIYYTTINADWIIDDVGGTENHDALIAITGIPDTTPASIEDQAAYLDSQDVEYFDMAGYDALSTGTTGVLLASLNSFGNSTYRNADGSYPDPVNEPSNWYDPYSVIAYFNNTPDLFNSIVMRGLYITPQQFELAWNDDGRWYPKNGDTVHPAKYNGGVSIVKVKFGDGNKRFATISPSKDGGFLIYETDSQGVPIGLVRVFKHDRTLSTIIEPNLLSAYSPR